jgi:hypothetical protein
MGRSASTHAKRQREQQRSEHAKEKDERRLARKQEKAERPPGESEEDPAIAGIVPGPQPPREDDW